MYGRELGRLGEARASHAHGIRTPEERTVRRTAPTARFLARLPRRGEGFRFHNPVSRRFEKSMGNRTFFTTAEGRMGLGPYHACVGDVGRGSIRLFVLYCAEAIWAAVQVGWRSLPMFMESCTGSWYKAPRRTRMCGYLTSVSWP